MTEHDPKPAPPFAPAGGDDLQAFKDKITGKRPEEPEAFCLMLYAGKPDDDEGVTVWNSRNGRAPFVLPDGSGLTLDPIGALRAPLHVPNVGDPVFVDGPDGAAELVETSLELHQAFMRRRRRMIAEAGR